MKMLAEVVTLYEPAPEEGEQSEFRREGLGYTYTPKGLVRFRVDYLKRQGQELWGQVEVRSFIPGTREFLVRARYNLSIDSARDKLARTCETRATGQGDPPLAVPIDWRNYIEVFCNRVDMADHAGSGIVMVGRLPELEPRLDLVEKLIQQGQITSLFGPQGEGKGWLAVKIAVHVQLGIPLCGLRVRQANVLYLDWEADRYTFDGRVKAICAGLALEPIEIPWFKPRGTIGHHVHYLAEQISTRDIGLAIWDSIGHAGGAPGEHGSYESVALDVSEAALAMGPELAHLWIDHVSGEGLGQKLAGKAIGSIRKMADARVAWEVRKAQEEEAAAYSIGLFHTKFNNTRRFAPLGFKLSFESDEHGRATSVYFEREDIRETDNEERLSPPLRIVSLLRGGGQDTKQIAERLDMTQAGVRTHCTRLVAKGQVVRLGGEIGGRKLQRWGLSATVHPLVPHVVTVGGSDPPQPNRTGVTVQTVQDEIRTIGSPLSPPPGTGRLPYAADDGELDDAPF